jgi:WD40-like Beta Propeller Repeat/MORN repeat variant
MPIRRLILSTGLLTSAISAQSPSTTPLMQLTPVSAQTIRLANTVERDGRLFDKKTGARVSDATIVDQYPSGAKRLRKAIVDGQAEGLWQEWYENGVPRYIASWKQGRGEGVWMYFHPTGAIRERSLVINDAFSGPVEGWYPNGVKEFDGMYDRNARAGTWRFWNSDGSRNREETYPTSFAELDTSATAAVPLLPVRDDDTMNQWEFGFTRDGRTLYHATGSDSQPRQIVVRRWNGATWSAPQRAPFSIPGRDGGSFVSSDGAWLWFSRSDSIAPRRRDLYRVSIGDTAAAPVRFTRTSGIGEINVSLDNRGHGFLWADRTADGRDAVGMRAVRLIGSQLRITSSPLTIPGQSNRGPNSPFVDPRGRFMIFANYGIKSGSQEDLFVSRLENGIPQPPLALTFVNSTANETAPYVTPDGRFLVFTSDRVAAGGTPNQWRIWVVPVARIAELSERK